MSGCPWLLGDEQVADAARRKARVKIHQALPEHLPAPPKRFARSPGRAPGSDNGEQDGGSSRPDGSHRWGLTRVHVVTQI